tara:strand:- start:1204 stop:1404 length:201 start_codon:yes stop_codon:yes gene_type:complete
MLKKCSICGNIDKEKVNIENDYYHITCIDNYWLKIDKLDRNNIVHDLIRRERRRKTIKLFYDMIVE